MSTAIIPSDKLRIVTVHKLKDLTCWRRYYWRWVRNLESRAINLNFFYGSALGAGFEVMLLGQDWQAAVQQEDVRRRSKYQLPAETSAEMDLQLELIRVILQGAEGLPQVREFSLEQNQVPVRMSLPGGLLYCGTADGRGTYKGVPSMLEVKTASQVNAAYLDALAFDPQLYSYAMCEPFAECGQCQYCIFPKPQKRVRRNDTLDDFIKRIEQDALVNPSSYYQFIGVPLGEATMRANKEDVEAKAEILQRHYEHLGREGVLDYRNWPKCPDKCFEYAGCEFLPLCKNPGTWRYYLNMYQQREMLYEEERAELAGAVRRSKKVMKKVLRRGKA